MAYFCRNSKETCWFMLYYEHCALFFELCDFSWIVRLDAIWGRLCEIAPSRNIRRPDVNGRGAKFMRRTARFCKISILSKWVLAAWPHAISSYVISGSIEDLYMWSRVNMEWNALMKQISLVAHYTYLWTIPHSWIWLIPEQIWNKYQITICPERNALET